jgi:hypothetical protein
MAVPTGCTVPFGHSQTFGEVLLFAGLSQPPKSAMPATIAPTFSGMVIFLNSVFLAVFAIFILLFDNASTGMFWFFCSGPGLPDKNPLFMGRIEPIRRYEIALGGKKGGKGPLGMSIFD